VRPFGERYSRSRAVSGCAIGLWYRSYGGLFGTAGGLTSGSRGSVPFLSIFNNLTLFNLIHCKNLQFDLLPGNI
jgi:hypothetical protein